MNAEARLTFFHLLGFRFGLFEQSHSALSTAYGQLPLVRGHVQPQFPRQFFDFPCASIYYCRTIMSYTYACIYIYIHIFSHDIYIYIHIHIHRGKERDFGSRKWMALSSQFAHLEQVQLRWRGSRAAERSGAWRSRWSLWWQDVGSLTPKLIFFWSQQQLPSTAGIYCTARSERYVMW